MNTADSDDDQPLPEPPMCTTLIIGRSNTGKSSLVRTLVKQYDAYEKDTFVLNDLTGTSPYTRITIEDLPKLSRCILVIEDVMSASNAMFK
jgi:tRNA U34 5-carboxymethylaminomethyl modifying GTPase MnmE/TrmE